MNIISAIALSIAAAASPASAFRGFELGGPCPTGVEWSLAEDAQDVQAWTRASEKLSIGDATITDIAYMCWTGGSSPVLYGVIVRLPATDGPALLAVLTAQWGRPYQSNRYLDQYLWSGGPVVGYLDYEQRGLLHVVHEPTQKRIDAAAKARAAAAGSDL